MGKFSRGAALLLGAVLLFSGVLKAADLSAFIREFAAYGIVTQPLAAALSAWALVGFECALGAALLLGYRPRLVLSATCGLFVLFLGALLWAWHAGTTADCGCFGALVKRSPAQAFAEDVVLLALSLFALAGAWARPAQGRFPRLFLTVAAGLAGLLLPLALGFSPAKAIAPPPPGTALPALTLAGPNAPDFSKGDWLLFVMDTSCEHCRNDVPAVNEIAREPGAPKVVALCANENGDVAAFVSMFQPPFSLFSIPRAEFSALLGSAPSTPRYLLVKSGRIVKTWDGRAPALSELSAAPAGA